MQTDQQRHAAIAEKDRQIAELKAKLGGGGPDLELQEYAFTYTWRGKTYGLNVIDVLSQLGVSPDDLRAMTGADEAAMIDRVKAIAGMPDDLSKDHVIHVIASAVRKAADLGKDLEPAPNSPRTTA